MAISEVEFKKEKKILSKVHKLLGDTLEELGDCVIQDEDNLKEFKKGARNIKLADLRSNFPPYNHLLKQLIKDKYVEKKDKLFLLSLKHDIKY